MVSFGWEVIAPVYCARGGGGVKPTGRVGISTARGLGYWERGGSMGWRLPVFSEDSYHLAQHLLASQAARVPG